MLVKDVLSFIREVHDFYLKNSIEDEEPLQLEKYFLELKPDEPVQLDLIYDFMKKRWDQIKYTGFRYTSDPSGLNLHYINFAKKINENKYLSILMPSITNTKDYNDLSPLAETKHLENFFIGNDGQTLYRKRSFYDLLVKNEYKLAIIRSFERVKLSALSIEELSGLESCKVNNSFITEEGLYFDSFWDFLYQKVFVNLQRFGQVPVTLLQSLTVLIEKYYSFQQQEEDYMAFKREARQFFQEILSFELNDINSFYGMKVRVNNDEFYLMEYLIKINQSQDYGLDTRFETLAQWLYQLSSSLRVKCKSLDRLYVTAQRCKESPVLCVILSLSVCSFPTDLFENENRITVWDKKNHVFPKGVELFNQLQEIIRSNSNKEGLGHYSEIKKVIAEIITESDLRSPEAEKWFQCVKSNSLDELGIHWFEPEFILHTLIRFDFKTEMDLEKKKFLDELIRTYRLEADNLLQRLRVNILFHHFCKSLPLEINNNLIQLVQLNSQVNVNIRQHFLSDSISYLKLQLDRIGSSKNIISFWKNTSYFNQVFADSEPKNLKEVIDRFCDVIEKFKKPLEESNCYMAMMNYLTFFSSSILTVTKAETVERSNEVFLYGQGTHF